MSSLAVQRLTRWCTKVLDGGQCPAADGRLQKLTSRTECPDGGVKLTECYAEPDRAGGLAGPTATAARSQPADSKLSIILVRILQAVQAWFVNQCPLAARVSGSRRSAAAGLARLRGRRRGVWLPPEQADLCAVSCPRGLLDTCKYSPGRASRTTSGSARRRPL